MASLENDLHAPSRPAEATGERRAPADPVVHYGYIDALRGVAFLLVLLVHAETWSNLKPTGLDGLVSKLLLNGVYGVQLFYLISAFTLFQSMDARSRRDIHPNRAFFARRFFRIAPLFWVAVAFYLAWYGLGPRNFAPDGLKASDIALTFAFLHGWHPVTINSVFPGDWSIAVEMVFYLTLPALYRWSRSPGRVVFLVVATLAICYVNFAKDPAGLLYPAWKARDPSLMWFFSYFWLPSQAPVFALGLLFSVLVGATRPGPAGEVSFARGPLCWSLAGVFLTLMAVSLLTLPKHVVFSVGFLVLAWALSIHPTRLLVNRATCFLGKISFSAYLIHFAALDVSARLLGVVPVGAPVRSRVAETYVPVLVQAGSLPGPVRLVLILAVALALTSLLSTITYRLVEEPGIRLGKLVIRKAGW